MSVRTIKAFFERIESDRKLQTKLRKVARENEKAAVAQVVEIAAEEGFPFTIRELIKARKVKVDYFPGFEEPKRSHKACCHYAQGCMPGFSGNSVEAP